MRRLALTLVLALAAPAARAEDPAPADDGFDLMEEGAKLLFEGIMREMAPRLDDMARTLQEAEPVLRSLLALVDDLGNYQAPERLPNGDILIRRKPGAPPPPALSPPSAPGEIEL
jgi:hypothetical protein